MIKEDVKISLYTIADLGEFRNLKTDQANAIIKGLGKNVVDIYCRGYKGKDKRYKNIIPGGRRSFQFFSIIKMFLIKKLNIYRIFDIFASFKNNTSDIAIFHPFAFRRTCRKLNKKGKITINFGTSALGKSVFNSKKEEYLKNGIEFNEKYFKDFFEESILESKYIFAQSEYCKSTYVMAGAREENVFVINPGIDINKFTPEKKSDDIFRVLAVGQYGILKGFQYLLKVWSELDIKNGELVILGNSTEEMKEIVKRYKKFNNIKFVSFANPLKFYHEATLLVHPSVAAEGSARVIKEAMACGLPIICTENSGSIVRDGMDGFVIPIQDLEAIKEKILYFYDNPDRVSEMGRQARINMEKNGTWENFSRKLAETIELIINKNE